jgi:hypothetical protein
MAGDQESKLKCLLLIQSRIAVCGVVQAQILFFQTFASAYALRDRITCQFEMDTTEVRAVLSMNLESARKLLEDR